MIAFIMLVLSDDLSCYIVLCYIVSCLAVLVGRAGVRSLRADARRVCRSPQRRCRTTNTSNSISMYLATRAYVVDIARHDVTHIPPLCTVLCCVVCADVLCCVGRYSHWQGTAARGHAGLRLDGADPGP